MKTMGDMIQALRQSGLLARIVKSSGTAEETWLQKLTYDSREVSEGTFFICKGSTFQREYLGEAVQKGCTAYLIDQRVYENEAASYTQMIEEALASRQNKIAECSVTGLIVTDIRRAMAVTAAVFYRYDPGRPMVTGITGTKGKTSTAWYLKAMLDLWQIEQGGKETGLISTIETFDGSSHVESVMTTPEAPVIHKILANAGQNRLSHLTMEVSSQALKYQRVYGMKFQVGVFLNISEDHISPQEHKDFEDYFSSKLSILRQSQTACVNLDCEQAERILKAAHKAGRILTFGKHPNAQIRYSDVRIEEYKAKQGGRISFLVSCDQFTERFSLAMCGRFNVENAVAAIAAASVYGVPVHCMKQALAETTVPGRMENFVSRDGKICAVVDFAHNRLSFEKLFDAAFTEYHAYKRIITVFGCPGGKALNRRRELGIIAGLFSDQVCITSDSPGCECQETIANEIKGYVEMTGCGSCCIPERKNAVAKAIELGTQYGERTLILVLGRGNENFQKIGKQICAYPKDAELVKAALAAYDRKRA